MAMVSEFAFLIFKLWMEDEVFLGRFCPLVMQWGGTLVVFIIRKRPCWSLKLDVFSGYIRCLVY